MNQTQTVAGWTLHTYEEVPSTNDLARNMPAWSAIRADVQTQGRGRHAHSWASGKGGLWLSCVIPTPQPAQKWEALPLAAGAAIIESLQRLGVGLIFREGKSFQDLRRELTHSKLPPPKKIDMDRTAVLPGPKKITESAGDKLRLRWPNDIMFGQKKLCGLLVERFNPETAVIGLGINVTNRPSEEDPSLDTIAVNLSQLLPIAPTLEVLTEKILATLRIMHDKVETEGWRYYRDFLNNSWDTKRQVECQLTDKTLRGTFKGVDPQGDLLLEDGDGQLHTLTATRVALFREI